MLRFLTLGYAGCTIGHVIEEAILAFMYQRPFAMSVTDALTGWWPKMATMASDIMTMFT